MINHIVEEYLKLVREGDEARRAGSAYNNPYREGTPAAMAWDDGWDGIMDALEITTSYDPKPIPFKGFDWIAVREDWLKSGAVGYGATEKEAIADLLEEEERLGED